MPSLLRFSVLVGLLVFLTPKVFALVTLRVRDGCDAQCAVYTQAAKCGTEECLCVETVAQGLQTCMDCSATSDNVQTTQRIIESYNLVCGGKNGVQTVTVPPVPSSTTSDGATASIISSIASQIVSAVTSALDVTSTSTTSANATSSSSALPSVTGKSSSLGQATSSSSAGGPTQSGVKSGAAIDGPNVLVGCIVVGMGMLLTM